MNLLSGTMANEFVKHREITFKIGHIKMIRMMIVDTETAAEVHIADGNTLRFQLVLQIVTADAHVAKRRHVRDLRTDMKMQPCETNMFHAAHPGEDTGQQAQVDAELVLLQTGCDFGMRMGVDIGIDPQGHPRRLLPFGRQPVDDPQLGQRFDVEACDVVFQPQPDLPVGLSHTGKDNFRRREAAR